MQSKGSAVWKGGFKDGRGTISTASGALKQAGYSVGSRFEGSSGTNPEELIAAAHAACFSMALSLLLGNAGITPESIETSATVSLDKLIGALARGTEAQASTAWRSGEGFLAITSRASYEIVHKAAGAGIAVIAAISAPTSLAIELAEQAGVTLIGFARGSGMNVYAHSQRLR